MLGAGQFESSAQERVHLIADYLLADLANGTLKRKRSVVGGFRPITRLEKRPDGSLLPEVWVDAGHQDQVYDVHDGVNQGLDADLQDRRGYPVHTHAVAIV